MGGDGAVEFVGNNIIHFGRQTYIWQPNTFPINRDVVSFVCGDSSVKYKVTRKQFPLSPGFAVTVHCSQGQTYNGKVVAEINSGKALAPISTYVAASRVTDFHRNLAIISSFSPTCITGRFNHKKRRDAWQNHIGSVKKEIKRLRTWKMYKSSANLSAIRAVLAEVASGYNISKKQNQQNHE